MKPSLVLAVLALFSAPALADLQVVSKSHTDAYNLFGKAIPAKDSTTTLWIAKDRLRIDSDGMKAIVRLDQKKLILLDPKEKVWKAIELPFDAKRYLPPEKALMADQMMGARALAAKLEEKDETKKIGEWNAKRYEITLSQVGNVVTKEIVWASPDIKIDSLKYEEMCSALMSITPEQRNLVRELGRIQGLPVRRERTQNLSSVPVTTIEEVTSALEKEPPAGLYDPPADWTEKPYELLGQTKATPPPAAPTK